MKVVLLKDIEKVGDKGDVKVVKNGFGRNYLLPRGLAILATEGTLKAVKNEKDQAAKKFERQKGNLKKVAETIEKSPVTVSADAGKEGKLFGAVTAADIAKAYEAQHKQTIDKRAIKMQTIKTLGEHKVSVHFGPGVSAELTVIVEANKAS